MKINCVIILILGNLSLYLFQNCSSPDHQSRPSQILVDNKVVIPEGIYVLEGNGSITEHKSKGGKILDKVIEIGKEQVFLSREIYVKENIMISKSINSAKKMSIETGININDSLFFIQLPILNDKQTVYVRLLANGSLKLSILNQEIYYSLKK